MLRGAMCVVRLVTSLLWQFSHLVIQYILNVINYRGGSPGSDVSGNVIDNIDDIRNGLLLDDKIHLYFGSGHLAFLKVCCSFHSGLFQNPNNSYVDS
jgi:hypothetical protein